MKHTCIELIAIELEEDNSMHAGYSMCSFRIWSGRLLFMVEDWTNQLGSPLAVD